MLELDNYIYFCFFLVRQKVCILSEYFAKNFFTSDLFRDHV